jgi:hypothetical protein
MANASYAPVHNINWDFPLWSEILPGLFLGGTDDDDTIEDATDVHAPRNITKKDFDTVVTLYAWATPVDWFVQELRYGFYDDALHGNADYALLHEAAEFAYASWKSGKKVLIRCQAGINRSSLVMGLALMMDGYPAAAAIKLMRVKRSNAVLLNEDFVDYLHAKDTNDKK